MGSVLQQEIKQTQPFASLRAEVLLNLSKSSAMLLHGLEHSLRPFGLSLTQYNVLRILRGAGADGLCQYEIRERLVAQVPDVPRILERMEKAGWIGRRRNPGDRRMVMTALTEKGLCLVDRLDAPLAEQMAGLFSQLSEGQLATLNDLLVLARADVALPCEARRAAVEGAGADGGMPGISSEG